VPIPRLHVPSASPTAGRVELPKNEAHHATRVLRLGSGDEVRVFDGRGHEWAGRIVVSSSRRDVAIEIDREVTPVAEPSVKVTLAIGLLKGDQMDGVVRDATALGVSTIVPMVTAHVTVPERAWKSAGRRQELGQTDAVVERWQRVAVASAKQCGRAVVPVIEPVTPLAAVLVRPADLMLMCAEPAVSGGPNAFPPSRQSSALVLIGPEGGWAPNEVEEARERGAVLFGLGPRTLRAELAPLVALATIWSRWGWN